MSSHILIADDDADVRRILRYALQDEGYRISDAHNGKVALAKFREDPADLVILDLVMPEKEGLETLGELREISPEVKVLVISGGVKDRHSYLDIAGHLGADQTMPKPLDLKQVLVSVAELLAVAT